MNCLHFDANDDQWVNPKYSPIVYSGFYTLFVYFKAVGEGDFQPLIDFLVEGKISEDFENHVKSEFGRPPKDVLEPAKKDEAKKDEGQKLYLFWVNQKKVKPKSEVPLSDWPIKSHLHTSSALKDTKIT